MIGVDSVVHESDALRLRGADAVAGADQLQRLSFAQKSRHALRAAVAGDDAECDFWEAEVRFFGGDPDVAGQRDLASTTEREAVDRGDDRLRKSFDVRQHKLAAL